MRHLRATVALCVLALLGPALFAQRAMEPDGSILLPAQKRVGGSFNPVVQHELSRSSQWADFVRRYGRWSVQWNEATGTPHRAYGPAINLTHGARVTRQNVEHAAMRFINDQPLLLNVAPSALRLLRAVEANGRWYVSYIQTKDGIDVLFSEVELRIFSNGNLMSFGSDFYDDIDVSPFPVLSFDVAKQQAVAGLALFTANPEMEGDGQLYYLPVRDGAKIDYYLVYRVMVRLNAGPGNPMDGNYMTYVDAHTGEIIWRYNLVHTTDVRGNIAGDIHPMIPTEPYETRALSSAGVTVGLGSTVTDSLGSFSINTASPALLVTRLDGPFVNVNRFDAADATISTLVNPGDSLLISWNDGNSHAAERDAFYHVNFVLDYLKNIDPAFVAMNYSVPCVVNYPLTCNAQWRGFEGMRFYAEGGGCPNTGQMPSVIYHEYGHGVNQRLYEQMRGFGMVQGGINEGTADILSAMVEDSPFIGRGFTGVGSILRNLNNTRRYPQDASGQVHNDGLIIGGTFWDLRLATSLETTRRLSHFAKYGTPDDADLGIALGEWFVETLVADDDDGNLANGTPNGPSIIQSFELHGIGPSLFFGNTFSHTPLPSTNDTLNSYTAIFTLDGAPIPGGDPDSVAVRYSTDNFITTHEVPATRIGATIQYSAAIPPQPNGTMVKYFITAVEPISNTRYTFPAGAPAGGAYRFLVGTQRVISGVVYAASAESPWGKLYTLEPATGTATEVGSLGIAEMHGLVIHPATKELLGIVAGSSSSAVYRVSPTFGDAFPATTIPVGSMRALAFHGDTLYGATTTGRLYRLNLVSGDTTFIGTANGIIYSALSFHPQTGVLWASVRPPIALRDRIYTVNTSTGAATLVGATGDNFITPSIGFSPSGVLYGLKGSGGQDNTLITIDQSTGTGTVVGLTGTRGLQAIAMNLDSVASSVGGHGDATVPASFVLDQNYPNPFNPETRIRYGVPIQSRVSVRVYDVTGREIRILAEGTRDAGYYEIMWDGKNRSGAMVGSGVYFLRLEAAGAGNLTSVQIRKMIMLR